MSIERIRELREQAKQRNRRIIFNDDGWNMNGRGVSYSYEENKKYFLDYRTQNSDTYPGLENSHVDSLFISSMTTDVFQTHNSRVVGTSTYGSRSMINLGYEPLNIFREWCSENNIELFYSFRMNDNHCGVSDEEWDLKASPFKKSNPELLMGTSADRTTRGRSYANFDYTLPTVREYILNILTDVCSRYDFEGLELDLDRTPPYFKSHYLGEIVSDSEREMMTQLIRDIRSMTERVSLERGKPILLTIRMSDSLDVCHHQGMDIRKWIEEGLIDIVTAGNEIQFIPRKMFVDTIKSIDDTIPTYICLSNAWIGDEERESIIEVWRARASEVWASGADGLYLFNTFTVLVTPTGYDYDLFYKIFNELGEPDDIKYKKKRRYINFKTEKNWIHYDAINTNPSAFYYGKELGHFMDERIPVFSDGHPLILKKGGEETIIHTPMYNVKNTKYASLKVKTTNGNLFNRVVIELNGNILSRPTYESETASTWWSYDVGEYIKEGYNTITFSTTDDTEEIGIKDMYIVEIPKPLPDPDCFIEIENISIPLYKSNDMMDDSISIQTPNGTRFIELVNKGSIRASDVEVSINSRTLRMGKYV